MIRFPQRFESNRYRGVDRREESLVHRSVFRTAMSMSPSVAVDRSKLSLDLSCVYHCEGVPFTGLARGYHRTSEGALILAYECYYENGMKHGRERRWYVDFPEQLASKRHFSQSVLTGVTMQWFRTGKMRVEEVVEHSIVVQRKTWDRFGNLLTEFYLSPTDPLLDLLLTRRNHLIPKI